MPLFEYILLGLLGSGGTAFLDSPPAGALTLGADAIVQPNGGIVPLAVQETPKKDDSHRTKQHSKIRAQHIKGESQQIKGESQQKSARHHRRRGHKRGHGSHK